MFELRSILGVKLNHINQTTIWQKEEKESKSIGNRVVIKPRSDWK